MTYGYNLLPYTAPLVIQPQYATLIEPISDPLEDALLEIFGEAACQCPYLALVEDGETGSDAYLEFNGEQLGNAIGHYINLERCFPPTYGLTAILSEISIPLMKAGAIDSHIVMKNGIANIALSSELDTEQYTFWTNIFNAAY
jgi:hypothetical protein